MSLESVKTFLAQKAPELEVIETGRRTATVAEAADVLGLPPARIAKTLSLRRGEDVFLVVVRGDARLDNRKAREAFGGKVRMLELAEVETLTGHPVGGVCPFGLAQPLPVYCDVSLKAFEEVAPAAGSVDSAVLISPARLAQITGAQWVDVCQDIDARQTEHGAGA